MKFVSLFILLISPMLLGAQYSFDTTFGSLQIDRAQSVVSLENGDFLVSGLREVPGKDWDLFLIKLSPNGKFLWEKNFGSILAEFGGYIALDSEGDILLVGDSFDSIYGLSDFLLYKLDPDGNVIWKRLYGGAGVEEAYSVAVNESGEIFTCGRTGSTTELLARATLSKFSPEGDSLWTIFVGDTLLNYGSTIGFSPEGEIILGGLLTEYRDQQAEFYSCLFLDRISNDGELIEEVIPECFIQNSGFPYPYDILPNQEGFLVASDKLRQFDERLNEVWSDPDRNGLALKESPFGGWYAFDGRSLYKYSPAKELEWTRHFPDFFGQAMDVTIDGGIVMVGYEKISSQGLQLDARIIKVNCEGEIASFPLSCTPPSFEMGDWDINLFPNPSSGSASVFCESLPWNHSFEFDVFDALGRRVFSKTFMGQGPHDFKLIGQADGIYQVRVSPHGGKPQSFPMLLHR